MQAASPRKRVITTSARIDQTAPAYVVVDKFGGLYRFCQLTGYPSSTVHDWLVKGLIPARRQEFILSLAAEHRVKVKPADFVPLARRLDRVADLAGHFHFAEKKGYSGVGLFARKDPSAVIMGFDADEFDAEGRWVETRFDTARRKLSIISCYFPSGSSGELRQAAKFRFLAKVFEHLMRLKSEREFILVGDINIAHNEIDLKNWRSNQKNSGFLPEERAWMTQLLTVGGLVDVFRTLNQQAEQYTWWSNRGQAWAKNVGWRLDYHLATPALAATARQESIYLAQRFSDHAPLVIDYGFKL